MPWSEDRLHRLLARWGAPRAALAGSFGHDAAVLAGLERARGGDARPVLCTDQLVEGVHFLPGTAPERVAAKAVARVLSDLAATAAEPRAVLLAVCAPRATAQRTLERLLAGARSAAATWGAALVGGDLCAAPGGLRLVATALGAYRGRRRPPGRERARPGDLLLVTGALGGSLLGRHLRVVPRLQEGLFAHHAGGARVLMDVSDGLALDAARIARASEVAIELDLARVPLHADAGRAARADGRAAIDHALHDGEDHELLVLAAPRDVARLLARWPRRCAPLAVIGRARAGRGLWLVAGDRGAGGGGPRQASIARELGAVARRWRARDAWVYGGGFRD